MKQSGLQTAETTIKIEKEVRQGLSDLAEKTYPRECCAVLFTRNGEEIDGYCNLPNKSRKKDCYEIDPMALYECEISYRKKGYEIAGFFHSHPDAPAVMSGEDVTNAIPSMLYLLATVTKDGCSGMRLWKMNG